MIGEDKMRIDPLISRRFEELTAKAKAVSKTREQISGGSQYAVSSPLFKEWATNALSLLEKVLGRQSVHYENFSKCFIPHSAIGWENSFEDCCGIFKAAREDYEGGYLFNVRALVKAEVLSDAFTQAKELLEKGYKDPACVLCRVALETVLKELSERKRITQGKLDQMNADLCKAGAYNMVKQKQITAWADIGNKAAHGKWDQYTEKDAQSMLDGVEALVADLF